MKGSGGIQNPGPAGSLEGFWGDKPFKVQIYIYAYIYICINSWVRFQNFHELFKRVCDSTLEFETGAVKKS